MPFSWQSDGCGDARGRVKWSTAAFYPARHKHEAIFAASAVVNVGVLRSPWSACESIVQSTYLPNLQRMDHVGIRLVSIDG